MYFGRGSPEVSVYESLLGDSDRIASDRNSIYVTDDQVRHSFSSKKSNFYAYKHSQI